MNVQQLIETAQTALGTGSIGTLDDLENYLVRAVSLVNLENDGFGILSAGDFTNIETVAGSLFAAKVS